MAKVLVIAFGNPLRSDDGLAWTAAEHLKGVEFRDPPAIHICRQLTPELAWPISTASTVIFLDAARSGEAGSLLATEVLPRRESSISTHEFSPSSILALSEQLYGHRPVRALCLSLSGECFEHGEKLSPRVSENLPRLVREIQRIVEQETPG